MNGLRSPDPRADLRALRLHVAGGSVCLAYETAGEVAGPMEFTFEIRDSGDTDHFRQRFIATVRRDGKVQLWGGGDALSVPAEIGMAGRSFSLVLDGRSFEEGQALSSFGSADPPLDGFGYTASVRTSVGGGRRVRDQLGPLILPQAYRYPEGGRCVSDYSCPAPPRLSAEARRVKPTERQACARVGGRIARSVHDPSALGCVVRYSGVPYDVPTRFDPSYRRSQRYVCRVQEREMREIGREIAQARHRPVRMDRFVWHPDTVVCETRTKGQLIRPR